MQIIIIDDSWRLRNVNYLNSLRNVQQFELIKALDFLDRNRTQPQDQYNQTAFVVNGTQFGKRSIIVHITHSIKAISRNTQV